MKRVGVGRSALSVSIGFPPSPRGVAKVLQRKDEVESMAIRKHLKSLFRADRKAFDKAISATVGAAR